MGTTVATLALASEEGLLRENEGKTVEDIVKNFIPKDNDDEPDSSDDEEDDSENTATVKTPRRSFPVTLGIAMFKDEKLKKFLDERKLPNERVFKEFIKRYGPLPEGFDVKDLKGKMNSKIQNLKRQDQKKTVSNVQKKGRKKKKETD